MKSSRYLNIFIALALWLTASDSVASPGEARRHVREGIRLFESGQFGSARQAFDQADVALPEDARIAFNRGCAAAAAGDLEKAAGFFRTSAQSPDITLSASSHFNLGCGAAGRGKAMFGEHPEEASGETRTEGLALLVQAVRHYRDCLAVQPDHQAARHNLEVLRLWIKHMQDVWKRRDRDQARDEMNVLQFLEMIIERQEQLRELTQALTAEDDSPRRRQAVTQAGVGQRELADEIEPLKQKVQAAVAQGQDSPHATGKDQVLSVLNALADRVRSAMSDAAAELDQQRPAASVKLQAKALGSLNEMYMALAPFASLLQKSIAMQQQLIDDGQGLGEGAGVDESADAEETTDADAADDVREAARRRAVDELIRRQEYVDTWAQILPLKAQHELDALAQSPNQPPASAAGPDPHEDQRAALKESMEKAVEIGPRIPPLTGEALTHLRESDIEQARPNQVEALKLLREIAASLPRNQDQQPNQNQDQKQQDSENDQQNPGQQQGDAKQRDENQKQPGEPKTEQQRQQDLSRQQAEAVLSKVRQREREHRERQQRVRALLRGMSPVDRNW